MFGFALYSTIFELAVLDCFTGLKLPFVVTKFPQKERVKGITSWSLFVYIPARFEYQLLFASLFLSFISYFIVVYLLYLSGLNLMEGKLNKRRTGCKIP